MDQTAVNNHGAFIWRIANLLRGTYKPAQYGSVILPFVVLRRLDCVLEPTKDAVLAKRGDLRGVPEDIALPRVSGHSFYNTSKYDMRKLLGDPVNLRANIGDYVRGFSPNVRDIFEEFELDKSLAKLDESDLLYLVTRDVTDIDLHPDRVSNADMGAIFEELIRKFAESSNETAGEHFTPRDAVSLVVDLLLAPDGDVLSKPGIVRHVYDPTAGTGGMLAVAEEHIKSANPDAEVVLAGQELNDESYAICKSDMVIKGYAVDSIANGDTLANDQHAGKTFDYCLANPPYGVEWKRSEAVVRAEHRDLGFDGRFGPGLPAISDGQLLFLLHLVSKMRPAKQGGGRVGIVLNGSALFTGAAGSGESEIRRYLLEHDLLEAIVALPTDMFYNTGIATYVWILDNSKAEARKGKVQLIDGTGFFSKMRKSLGSKRRELKPSDIDTIVKLYDGFEPGDKSKIFATKDFGYRQITVERPLQLSFLMTSEKIDAAMAGKAVAKLADADRAKLKGVLASLVEVPPPVVEVRSEAEPRSHPTWTSRDSFTADLKKLAREAGLTLGAPILKALVGAIGEHDPAAEVCRTPKGDFEPDTSLRDTERVPLSESIDAYMKREVLPHVPDAWVD
ncbi:MAG: type I restriction-modification system subunit M, partial [Actinomycetota bacterium]|nr:type I restriction-modification system subunit M [Actinomycetota bacterium]